MSQQVDAVNAKQLRIVFAGTPEFAAKHLETLIAEEFNVVGVYTQPDRPANRGKKLTPSPTKVIAEANQLPVFQPKNFKSPEAIEALQALKPDLMIVVAYGLLLPKAVLEIAKYGCINVHGSLLPKWRGAAPIQRAVEAGDNSTGVTIMQMDEGLDTGDMLLKAPMLINQQDTAGTVHDRMIEIGKVALIDAVHAIAQQSCHPEKQQDQQATYAHKIDKKEAAINWQESCDLIERKIRAFNPFPMCFSFLGDERIRIGKAEAIMKPHNQTPGTIVDVDKNGVSIACGEGILVIKELQLPGKKMLPTAQVLASKPELFQPMYIFSSGQ